MSWGREQPVLPHNSAPPISILVELSPQRAERIARYVGRPDSAGLPYGTTRLRDAQTQLVVLVTDQLLVKPAKRDEIGAPPGAQIDGVHGPCVICSPRFCAA